jgi:hypothetical protein
MTARGPGKLACLCSRSPAASPAPLRPTGLGWSHHRLFVKQRFERSASRHECEGEQRKAADDAYGMIPSVGQRPSDAHGQSGRHVAVRQACQLGGNMHKNCFKSAAERHPTYDRSVGWRAIATPAIRPPDGRCDADVGAAQCGAASGRRAQPATPPMAPTICRTAGSCTSKPAPLKPSTAQTASPKTDPIWTASAA